MIFSDVPEPAGFAVLGQEVLADDYRGSTVVLHSEFRGPADALGRAGLFVRVQWGRGRASRGPLTERAVFADPDITITPTASTRDWTRYQVAARIPGDCEVIVFGIFIAGRGRIEMRKRELIRRA